MVKIPIFSDVFGTVAGDITVDNENISVNHRNLKIKVPIGYLYEVIPLERKELGKIRTRIIIYDTVGMKNELECILSDQNFFLLKSFIKR
jgi:hypothetical protein